MNKNNLSKSDELRFWSKINCPENINDCWFWTGYCNKGGYGKFNLYGQSIPVHRISWEYFNGPIPNGLVIRHKCDNPQCCNPDHLEIGTQNDNIQDMINRGRDIKAVGSKHWNAVLSEQDIENILNGVINGKFSSINNIMNHYNMSRNAIVRIFTGELWTNVTKKFTNTQLSQMKSLIMRPKNKFTEIEIRDIKQRILNNESNVDIGKIFNVDPRLISNIRCGHSYSYVK